MWQRLIVACAMLPLLGCASIVPALHNDEGYFKHHYILAHENGHSMSTERQLLGHRVLTREEAVADIDDRLLMQGVDRYARRLWPDLGPGETRDDQTLELLVFVHGGLNGYRDDIARMRAMLARPSDCDGDRLPERLFVSAECTNAQTKYYPIFINWNSELWDSIKDDLFVVRRGKEHPVIGAFTWPFVLAARLAEAVFAAPYSWVSNAEDFFGGGPEFLDLIEGGALFIPRSLATPLVKAFGKSAWDIMKRRAALVASPEFANRPYEGAGFTLLRRLSGRIDREGYWVTTDPPNTRVRVSITFVAHSMGAIVVNRLLAESIHLDRWLPVKRIVYLAPASSINDVAVINHFRLRSQGTRFWTFALQRSDETWESHWLSPRGSLLVWIDNYFETVVERGDARYGRTASYRDRYSVYFEWKKPLGEEIFNVCEWSSAEDRPKTHHAVADPKYLATALWHIGKEVFESQVSPGTATDAIVCANRAIAQDSVPTAGDVEQAPLTSAGQREDAAASIPASRE